MGTQTQDISQSTLQGKVTGSKIITRGDKFLLQAIVQTAEFPVICIWELSRPSDMQLPTGKLIRVIGQLHQYGERRWLVKPRLVATAKVPKLKAPKTHRKWKFALAALVACFGFSVLTPSQPRTVPLDSAKSAVQSSPAATTASSSELRTASSISASQSTPPKSAAVVSVEAPTDCSYQPIPFQSTTRPDSSLESGISRVTTYGRAGSQKVCYPNGRTQPSVTSIITQPTTQVTSIGTHVTPTPAPAPTPPPSTYTNVNGNQIESPDANTIGASAQCRDGSYSHSVHRSGTCSGHGGVATWL